MGIGLLWQRPRVTVAAPDVITFVANGMPPQVDSPSLPAVTNEATWYHSSSSPDAQQAEPPTPEKLPAQGAEPQPPAMSQQLTGAQQMLAIQAKPVQHPCVHPGLCPSQVCQDPGLHLRLTSRVANVFFMLHTPMKRVREPAMKTPRLPRRSDSWASMSRKPSVDSRLR